MLLAVILIILSVECSTASSEKFKDTDNRNVKSQDANANYKNAAIFSDKQNIGARQADDEEMITLDRTLRSLLKLGNVYVSIMKVNSVVSASFERIPWF